LKQSDFINHDSRTLTPTSASESQLNVCNLIVYIVYIN